MIDSNLLRECYLLLSNYWLSIIFTIFGVALVIKGLRIIGVVLFIIAVCSYFYTSNGFASKQISKNEFKVVTFSLRSSSNEKLRDINSVITEISPDILLLQEVDRGKDFQRIFNANYPNYQYVYDENKSTALLTKHKVLNHGFVGNIQKVKIELHNQVVTIFNLHAPKFFLNYDNYNRFYNKLFNEIEQLVDESIILGGDFNLVTSNTPREIIKCKFNFIGALTEHGSGSLNTFPGPGHNLGIVGAIISIDEIYIRGFKPVVAKVMDINSASDHKPVIAYMGLL